jgi:ribosomal protein L29
MTIEEAIVRETGKTFEEIRAMSDVELYAFIENIREEAFNEGYDEAY